MSKVLVVDDDPALAEMLGIVLRQEGLDAAFVADGDAALGAFRRERPDLVLLDLKMPRMSGLEVLGHLRADETTRDLPVVVLTSSEHREDREEALRLGATWFVCKPTDGRRLRSEIQQLAHHWARVTA